MISLQNDENSILNVSTLDQRNLSFWGLPDSMIGQYKKKGVTSMFDWQLECLTIGNVLKGGNLVYSAPTSAGKTLVAEILIAKTLLEKQKKALMILPFVSVVREKMFYFKDMFSLSGLRVEGYMGGHTPSTSFQQVNLAVCTIEKANSLINRLMEEKEIDKLGMVVVDELHLLGDPYRGYLLELLLTKLKYMSTVLQDINIQIVGMSATLPNLKVLADWLDADLFHTNFRPVPLAEHLKCEKIIFDKSLNKLQEISPIQSEIPDDSEHVGQLCIETISNGHSVLIFCPTKVWCENLANKIATFFRNHGCSKAATIENSPGWILKKQLNLTKINEVLDHLKMCPVGLDKDLHRCIAYSVAFHHAGLTLDERDIIEGSFRQGIVRVLCATSTLSSGVNLPARRVIIRSPMSFGGLMDILTYRQMIGRAGRMGVDTHGESILISKPSEKVLCEQLMKSSLKPIESCLGEGRLSASLKRAILEIVASGVASSPMQVKQYANCTFLGFSSQCDMSDPILTCIKFLEDNEFLRLHDNGRIYKPTPLGQACLASSLPPDEGLSLFRELERARRCFVLDTDLHIIYQVTPYSVSEQWNKIDWLEVLSMLEELPPSVRRVGELVGVQDSFLVKVVKGTINPNLPEHKAKLSVHRRFYTALALQDLVNEVPLTEVADRFHCNKGMLQSLQQSAATYAGMVTEFCRRLGWGSIELIISQFQQRLQFGIQRELCDLMRLPQLNGVRARTLFNAGFKNISMLANANVFDLENALHMVAPFQTKKDIGGETSYDVEQRNKLQGIWVTGRCGLTVHDAAEEIITEARSILELELGLDGAKWGAVANQISQISATQRKKKEDKETVKTVCDIPTNNEDKTNHNPEKSSFVKEEKTEIGVLPQVEKKQCDVVIIENEDFEVSIIKEVLAPRETLHIDKTQLTVKSKSSNDTIAKNSHINKTDYFMTSLNFDDIVIEVENKENVSTPEHKKNISSNSNRFSSDLFDIPFSRVAFMTPEGPTSSRKNNFIESTETSSPDLFSQSLTFDTQLNRFLDSEEDFNTDLNKAPPLMPASSLDDLGFCSDSSPSKSETKKPVIGSSFFDVPLETQVIFDVEKPQTSNINIQSKRKTPYTGSPDLIPGSDESYVEDLHATKRAKLSSFLKPKKNTKKLDVVTLEDSDDEILATPRPRSIGLSNRFRSRLGGTNISAAGKVTQPFLSKDIEVINIDQPPNEKERKLKDINLIEVGTNRQVFKSFCEEIKYQSIIGMALGCKQNTEAKAPLIGPKTLRQRTESVETRPHCSYQDIILDGIAFYWKDNDVFYMSMASNELSIEEKITFLVSLTKQQKTFRVFDTKEHIKLLKQCTDVFLESQFEDPKIASWLISKESSERNFSSLTLDWFPEGSELITLLGHMTGTTSPSFQCQSAVPAKLRASVQALLSFCILKQQLMSLDETKLTHIFRKTEMPVAVCLADMELHGFHFNKDILVEVKTTMENMLTSLELKAHQITKRTFSISSHAAVSKILYNDLRLGNTTSLTKGKKKPSTSKEALQSLAYETGHPLPEIILQWRKLRTCLSKVISSILQISNGCSRVHGCSEMHTLTGRITMHEPNMQNIPRDFLVDDVTISVRSVFTTPPGRCLVTADYKQLELRLLAHLSQDQVLIDNIMTHEDVFNSIASAIKLVPLNKVTKDMRQEAKQTCYGIIYGIGARSLAQQLKMSEESAAILMEDFKKKYQGVNKYLEDTLTHCRNTGYVSTLSGRRRYLPGINHDNAAVRSEAERQAVNTTVQGSAADLAKTAMVAVRARVKQEGITATLVLHLHDELLYEVKQDDMTRMANLLKEVMESVLLLSVPLPVRVYFGHSWGQLQQLDIFNGKKLNILNLICLSPI